MSHEADSRAAAPAEPVERGDIRKHVQECVTAQRLAGLPGAARGRPAVSAAHAHNVRGSKYLAVPSPSGPAAPQPIGSPSDRRNFVLISVLGHLRIGEKSPHQPLKSSRLRSLLTALALNEGTTVSQEVLSSWVWGESGGPASVSGALYTCMSRLRDELVRRGHPELSAAITTSTCGYTLCWDRSQIDASAFEDELRKARVRLRDGRLPEALQHIESSLRLWAGPALADIPPTGPVERASTHLEEARFSAELEEISINLKLRRPAEAREKAVGLAVKYPLSESVSQVTMVALEQSGRRSEALSHYWNLHKRLADELGISPGADLGNLYTRLLQGESLFSSASPLPL
ncbi:hypothetical protein GCM10010129_73110 [Streptomyces fumigatiscleroticus]|nr:hypothetical protein GCM10010129_73110 [Streptomyces fumigatiscleroticus]